MNNLRSQLSLENIALNATSYTVGGVPVIAVGCIAIAAVLVGSMYTQNLMEDVKTGEINKPDNQDIIKPTQPQKSDGVMSGGKKSKIKSKTKNKKHQFKSSKRKRTSLFT